MIELMELYFLLNKERRYIIGQTLNIIDDGEILPESLEALS